MAAFLDSLMTISSNTLKNTVLLSKIWEVIYKTCSLYNSSTHIDLTFEAETFTVS